MFFMLFMVNLTKLLAVEADEFALLDGFDGGEKDLE